MVITEAIQEAIRCFIYVPPHCTHDGFWHCPAACDSHLLVGHLCWDGWRESSRSELMDGALDPTPATPPVASRATACAPMRCRSRSWASAPCRWCRKVARQPRSSYRASWRSKPWWAMLAATLPVPAQASSRERRAHSKWSYRGLPSGLPHKPRNLVCEASAKQAEHQPHNPNGLEIQATDGRLLDQA